MSKHINQNYKVEKKLNKVRLRNHHHPTQYITHIEKLWTLSGEGRMAATHTLRGERDKRSPPARERHGDVATPER